MSCIYYVNLGQTPRCALIRHNIKSFENTKHYTKIFLIILGRSCNKAWAYTRVPQYEFVGTANEEVIINQDLKINILHLEVKGLGKSNSMNIVLMMNNFLCY